MQIALEEYQAACACHADTPTADNYRLMIGAEYRWQMAKNGGEL